MKETRAKSQARIFRCWKKGRLIVTGFIGSTEAGD
jgi:hypothetical protein